MCILHNVSPTSTVHVVYTGWSLDGATRHTPIEQPLLRHVYYKARRTRELTAELPVGNARVPRVRINYARIWPHATVRQISVEFDIFRLVQPRTHLGFVVCEGRQVCFEKKFDTGQ